MTQTYQKRNLRPSLLDHLTDDSLHNVSHWRDNKKILQAAILERCEGKVLVLPVVRFICDVWRQVLFHQLLEANEKGVRYNRQLGLLDDLVSLASRSEMSSNNSVEEDLITKSRIKQTLESIRDELFDSNLAVSSIKDICTALSSTLQSPFNAEHNQYENVSKYLLLAKPLDLALYESTQTEENFPMTAKKMRDLVKRDLAWLLNTTSLECTQNLDAFPYTKCSVLNYGVPNLTGITVSNIDVNLLQRHMQKIILNYEPRIIKKSLKLEVRKRDTMSLNSLFFDIECDICARPNPEHLIINSEIDLETGAFKISSREMGA